MSYGWQPGYSLAQPLEVRGYGCFLAWNGRALSISRYLGGRPLDVAVPGGQVAAITIKPLSTQFIVTTAAGTRYRVYYWPWQGARFRALRDAVLAG